jgi:hypothetical protein
MEIEILKKLIDVNSEDKLNNVVANGILGLSDEEINTVSFIFWFCYLVETDLNDVLTNCWKEALNKYNKNIQDEAVKIIKEKVFKDKNKNIDNLEYFSDKIKFYIFSKGKNGLSKLLWKVNDIRNNLSHNRIDELEYKNRSLYLKETKKELLIDYFTLMKKDEFVFEGSFKDVLSSINFNK